MRMKFSFLAVFILSAFSVFSQVPTGFPMTNSKGWIKYAYLQSDSGSIPARRDTNFTARYPTIVYWENSAGSDTSFWVSNGRTSGRKWVKYGEGWGLKGNSGTSKTANFIGTTDINPIVFKVNNVLSGLVDTVTYNTALGYGSLNATTTGLDNTAIGYKSMNGILDGFDNTAVGYLSMQQVQNGNGNTGVGYKVLSSLTNGDDNAAFGDETLQSVSTGVGNAVFGNQAGKNITGSGNTSAGNSTFTGLIGGSFNTALGNGTGGGIVTGSNNTIVGARVSGLSASLNNNVLIADGTGTVKIKADSIGNVYMPLLSTQEGTADKMMVIDTVTKKIGYQPIPSGGGASLSSLTVATAPNTIDNGSNVQEWQWNSLTNEFGGYSISSSSLSSGTLHTILVNSTAAASGTQRGLYVNLTGANANSTQTTIAMQAVNQHTGTASTNTAFYAQAISGTNNNAIITGGGNIGFGTNTPDSLLTVNGGLKFVTGRQGAGKVLVSDASGGADWQTPTGGTNYWTSSGGNIYNNTGTFVGVGTSSPTSLLTIGNGNLTMLGAGAGGLPGIISWGLTYGGDALRLYDGGAGDRWGWGLQPGNMQFHIPTSGSQFYSWNGGGDLQTAGVNELMRLNAAGRLGIGTTSPTGLLDVNSDVIRLRSSKTPSSATDTGNAGDICWDANYIYICTATNTWKRSAIATW